MKKPVGLMILLIGVWYTFAFAVGTPRYASPKPGAKHVAPQASILLRFDHPESMSPDSLHVSGSQSGRIQGTRKWSADGSTLFFQPAQDFAPHEKVTVTLNGKSPYEYSFQVAKFSEPYYKTDEFDHPIESLKKTNAGTARIMPNGVSVPSDFPHIDVMVNSDPAEGYIFINNWRDDNPYNIIYDNDGSPIWYLRTPDGDRRRDFKVQDNGNLSMLVRRNYPFGQGWIEMDHTYTEVDSFHAVDGYASDEHELQILEDGHYLLLGIRTVQVDMRQYIDGGQPNASVHVTAIQEFNADGELVFLWDALEQIDYMLPFVTEDNPRAGSFRYPHMNAIDIDTDGNILLSARHLSTVFKIDRQTGEIIWYLGGELSDFDFVNDDLDGFANQHDIRSLGNNHYTVFDNGNRHNPPRSRGVEYELDLQAGTATLAWEYRNPEGTSYSYYMGNHQVMANGNHVMNWAVGDRPKITEVTPSGEVVYEMNFEQGYHSYRAFRFPWEGNAAKPYLLLESLPDRIMLIFNKFGDKDVEYYNIYAGNQSNPANVIATSTTTLKELRDLDSGFYYFRVTAVYADGSESEFSNQVSAAVQYIEPGTNLINNGDFSNNADGWTWEVRGGASANLEFVDGAAHFDISAGGGNIWEVQLRQNGLPLIQGVQYIFEFDAWADRSRAAEIKVGEDSGDFTNYSEIGYSALGTRKKHFTYEFVMNDPSDLNGRVVINTGTDDADVYIDNLSLIMIDTLVDEPNKVVQEFNLHDNYPNPFNPVTMIQYELAEKSDVDMTIYNVLGERVRQFTAKDVIPGEHHYLFNGSDLASGVYIYSLRANSKESNRVYVNSKKMTLLK